MADTAEIVTVRVQAELDRASSSKLTGEFDAAMGKVEASAGKAEAAVSGAAKKIENDFGGVNRAGEAVGRGLGDVFGKIAGGEAPMKALADEARQMAGALAGGGGGGGPPSGPGGGGIVGAGGRVIAMFGGPWGVALLAAGYVLTKFLDTQKDESVTLDAIYEKLVKAKAQTALNAEADRMWSQSLDGLIERQKKLGAELDKRLATQADLQRQAIGDRQNDVAQASAAVANAKTPEERAKAQAALTRANILLFNTQQIQARETGAALSSLSGAAKAWGDAQTGAIRKIVTNHPELQSSQHLLEAVSQQVQRAAQSAAGAGVSFGGTGRAVRGLNDDLLRGKIGVTEYVAEVKRLASSLEATAAAASKKGGKSGTGLRGNQVDQAEAAAIARQAGLQVNSSERPTYIRDEKPGGPKSQERLYNEPGANTPGRPVAKPGTSAHEMGGDKWALDIQRTVGVTAASITKTFADKGIELTKIITEHGGRVFHVEGSRSNAARGERAENSAATRAAREAEAAQDLANRQTATYNSELADLQQKITDAYTGVAASMAIQLENEIAAIDAQRDEQVSKYQSAAILGRITTTQADTLIEETKALAEARKVQLQRSETARVAELDHALAVQRQEEAVNEAATAVDNAKTGDERRVALLALLDAEQQLQRLALQRIIDATVEGDVQHEIAELKLAQLDAEKARQSARIKDDPANKSPGDRYRDDLNQTAGQINEAMEGITVDGLKTLEDGLVGVVMGTKSVADAFKDMANQIISQLIRIAIQQLIMKPIAEALFGAGAMGGGGGGAAGGGGGGGLVAALGRVLSGIFTKRAGGGHVNAGGAYWVGERGPEPFFPSQSGTIIPNDAAAALSGGRGTSNNVALTVNAPGATMETVAMIRRELAAAAPMIVSAAQRSTISQMSRTRT